MIKDESGIVPGSSLILVDDEMKGIKTMTIRAYSRSFLYVRMLFWISMSFSFSMRLTC